MFDLQSPTVSAASESPPDPTTPASDELALIRATLDGDTRAYGEIVHLHQRRIYNFIYQLTRNRHDTDDLTQQTFIKAYRHLAGFDPRRPLVNWLLTIARHTTLNHFRDTKKWSELAFDTAGSEPSPARSAEMRERASQLWDRARAILPSRQFEVLWLRFGEDLSTEETARVVGLTQTHVKVLVFRARQALLKGET